MDSFYGTMVVGLGCWFGLVFLLALVCAGVTIQLSVKASFDVVSKYVLLTVLTNHHIDHLRMRREQRFVSYR